MIDSKNAEGVLLGLSDVMGGHLTVHRTETPVGVLVGLAVSDADSRGVPSAIALTVQDREALIDMLVDLRDVPDAQFDRLGEQL